MASRITVLKILTSILLLVLFGGVIYGIAITPSLLKKDFSDLVQEEKERTEAKRVNQEKLLESRREVLEDELKLVDSTSLRAKAREQYRRELNGRNLYDQRYALSSREKAQLKMRSLASDSAKSLNEAIISVAREASPTGADVNVDQSSFGVALDIDFDMSSMTSGEHGTRTKHHTKESLRREVIELISRATNDIFQFCKDLELETINVGCRHHVSVSDRYERIHVENTMLYKIRLQRGRIDELKTNPFLDVYSTTEHFEIIDDNFDEIEIVTSPM